MSQMQGKRSEEATSDDLSFPPFKAPNLNKPHLLLPVTLCILGPPKPMANCGQLIHNSALQFKVNFIGIYRVGVSVQTNNLQQSLVIWGVLGLSGLCEPCLNKNRTRKAISGKQTSPNNPFAHSVGY